LPLSVSKSKTRPQTSDQIVAISLRQPPPTTNPQLAVLALNSKMEDTKESEVYRQSEYKLTEHQLSQIEAEIKRSQPLTSQLLPIEALIAQYSSEEKSEDEVEGFLASSKLLSKKYTHMRRIRGDGNCYYRAFLYALCEGLLHRRFVNNSKDAEAQRVRQFVTNSLSWVCTLGYEESTIEMFYDELMELFDFIDNVPTSPDTNNSDTSTPMQSALNSLHSKLNEENSTSDYCTWYLRVLTSAQMKSDPDRYLPFLLAEDSTSGVLDVNTGVLDIPTFCSREVEPMNRECGMVQVAALAECFGVRVCIEYMDGRVVKEKTGEGYVRKVACHEFGLGEVDREMEDRMSVCLLYRPGHYDMLY
jgi:ubiquitin thioesterase protein OTUB1